MSSRIPELLQMLYDMIRDAWGLPLGTEKCVIERDKALDLLEEIRTQFPTEIAEAQRLVSARAEFVNSAKREAEAIRRTAEERARQLIDEQEIIRISRARSHEMLASAESSTTELRRVANEYVDEAMKRTEESLAAALDEIRQSRAKFKVAASAMPAPPPPIPYEDEDDEVDDTDE